MSLSEHLREDAILHARQILKVCSNLKSLTLDRIFAQEWNLDYPFRLDELILTAGSKWLLNPALSSLWRAYIIQTDGDLDDPASVPQTNTLKSVEIIHHPPHMLHLPHIESWLCQPTLRTLAIATNTQARDAHVPPDERIKWIKLAHPTTSYVLRGWEWRARQGELWIVASRLGA